MEDETEWGRREEGGGGGGRVRVREVRGKGKGSYEKMKKKTETRIGKRCKREEKGEKRENGREMYIEEHGG